MAGKNLASRRRGPGSSPCHLTSLSLNFSTCDMGNGRARFLETGRVHGPGCLAQCLVHSEQDPYCHYYFLWLFSSYYYYLIIGVSYWGKKM